MDINEYTHLMTAGYIVATFNSDTRLALLDGSIDTDVATREQLEFNLLLTPAIQALRRDWNLSDDMTVSELHQLMTDRDPLVE